MSNNSKIIYRMSAAGHCPKRLSASRLGLESEPLPQFVYTAAEEGNWHEDRIVKQLRDEGNIVYDQQLEISMDKDNFRLVGHIDGKICKKPHKNPRLLEIKSMSQYQFDKWLKGGFVAFPQYAAQIACYSLATGLKDICYIVKNRSSGYKDIRNFTIEENGLFNTTGILDKIAKVEKLALADELYPANFEIESNECKQCEYKYLCLPEPVVLNNVDERILQMAVDRWRTGKELVDKGNELANRSKKILQAYADAQPEKKFRKYDVAVSMYNVTEAEVSYTRKAYTACKITDLKKESNNE